MAAARADSCTDSDAGPARLTSTVVEVQQDEYDTPQRTLARDRDLVAYRYAQITSGTIKLSSVLRWIKEEYGIRALYVHSLRDWSRAVTCALAPANRDLIKDVVSTVYDEERNTYHHSKDLSYEKFRKTLFRVQAEEWTTTAVKLHENVINQQTASGRALTSLSTCFSDEMKIVVDVEHGESAGGTHQADVMSDDADDDEHGESAGGAHQADVMSDGADEDISGDVCGDRDAHKNNFAEETVGKKDMTALAAEEKMVLNASSLDVISLHGNRNAQAVVAAAGEGYFLCPTCNSKRKADGEEDIFPQYEKRARTEFPTRIMAESDIVYAFRILGYLQEAKFITRDQETRCRQVLAQDLSKDLVAALMAYAVDRNNDKVVGSVEVVAPRPPPFLTYLGRVVTEEIKRLTLRTVTNTILKGAAYTAAVFGAAVVLRVKELY